MTIKKVFIVVLQGIIELQQMNLNIIILIIQIGIILAHLKDIFLFLKKNLN